MVRENNNFDDSDSDWDSLALAAEPAPLNHVVSDKLSEHHRGTKRTFWNCFLNCTSLDELVSDEGGKMANTAAVKRDPIYSEIIRPNSNDRKGPLTFVDRRSNNNLESR